MKLTLLLAFLAVAAASSRLLEEEISIRPGKDYVYDYVSQVLTGVSVDNIQYAGLKLKCQVRLQTKDGTKVYGKFENVNILKLNRELNSYHPTDIVPDREWRQVNGQEKEAMVRELIKPFTFKMVPGKLIDLEAQRDDQPWSVNMKRGYLSFLQIDLQNEEPSQVSREELAMESKLTIPSTQQRGSARDRRVKNYKVTEEDITGKCESVYAIQDDDVMQSRDRRSQVFKVTKVKNFDKCIERPIFKFGAMESVIFGTEYQLKRVNNWQMEVDYQVQGNREQFLIRGAKLTSKQHFNQLDIQKGKLLTYTTEIMTLTSVEETRGDIRLSGDVSKKESLIMEIPEPMVSERQASQRQVSEAQTRAQVQLIEELLEEAVRKTTPFLKVNATIPMGAILFAMKELPIRELESLIEKYCTPSGHQQKGEILLDLLPTTTRSDIVPTILKLVQNNVITDTRASYMIYMVGIQSNPTPNLARDLLTVMQQEQQLERRAPWTVRGSTLALGTVAFKLQKKKDTHNGRKANLDPIVSRIAQELNQRLQNAPSTTKKITILKAMGNAGLSECVETITRFIHDPSQPRVVREKAIYALRLLAPSAPSNIQNICMPIYLNMSKPQKERVACFLVIMESRPSLGVAKMISQLLKKERSLGVGSFVYSFMKDFSELQDPNLINVTTTVKTALQYAKPIRPGIQYSHGRLFDTYSKRWQSGMTFTLEYLMSQQSFIPEAFIFREDYNAVGFPFKAAQEWGIELEGLQTLMKNVVGPKSMLKDFLQGRLSLKDILEPIQHPSPSMLADIRAMMDKISITERDLKNFAFMVYHKDMNFESNFFRFDSSSLQDVFQTVLQSMPAIVRRLEQGLQYKMTKTLPLFQGAMVVPTPAGFPLSMNISWIQIIDVDTRVTMENIPSIRDLLSLVGPQRRDESDIYGRQSSRNWRSSSTSPEAKAQIYFRPSYIHQMDNHVEIRLPYVKTGVTVHSKIYSTVPFRAEIKLDLQKQKLKTKLIQPMNEEVDVFRMVENTKTFLVEKHLDDSRRDNVEEKVVRFPSVTRFQKEQKTWRIPFLDMDVKAELDEAVPTRPTTLLTEIFVRKNLTVRLAPCSNTPREIEIESLYLGPEKADRASQYIRELLGHADSSSESQDADERHRQSNDAESDSWWWTPSISSWRSGRDARDVSRDSDVTPFDPVHVDPSISRPLKYKLVTIIKRHGGHSEDNKIQLQVTHIQDQDLMKCQHDYQAIYYGQKKVVAKSFVDLLPLKKYLLDGHSPLSASKELFCKMELHHGPKQYTEKKYDVELKLGRGAPLHLSRVPSSRFLSANERAPLEVSAEVEYHQVPHPVYKVCKKAKEFLKALPYITKYVTVDTEDKQNPPNKVKLVAEFRSNETEVELLLLTPTEDVLIKNVPIPFLPRRDAVCSLSDTGCYNKYLYQDMEAYKYSGQEPVKSFVNYITGGKFPGKCHILREEVHTYDKKMLRLPKTDCETVLAKDCSSSQYPSFMVTTSKKDKESEKKIVHIYLPEHKIKIEPEQGWFESGLEVEINGRKIHVPDHGSKITIYKDDNNPRSEKICDIKKKDQKIEVYSHQSQIKVKSDGIDVSVQVHPSYYGQLCGVCSNYNGEPSDDFMGPRKELYHEPEQFLLSYIIPDNQCNIQEVRQQLSRHSPLLQSNRQCVKQEKNIKVERKIGNERQTCFSIQPVPKCEGSCDKTAIFKKKEKSPVAMKCLNSKDARTQRLLQQYRQGEILTELQNQEPNAHEQVVIPDRCVPKHAQDVRQ